MNWIEKIRQKPQEQKIKLIWTVVIVTALLLIIIWILLARFQKSLPKDTSLLKAIGKGFQDVKDNFKK